VIAHPQGISTSVIASEAKQSSYAPVGAQIKEAEIATNAVLFVCALRAQLDCFVASLLAMTAVRG
jgi:hypothetical protein